MKDARSIVCVEVIKPDRCILRDATHEQSMPAAALGLHATGDSQAVYFGKGLVGLASRILSGPAFPNRSAFWDVLTSGRWVDIDRASFLLNLAGTPPTQTEEPLAFSREWLAADNAGPYGRFGIGIEVAFPVAMNAIPLPGIRLANAHALTVRLVEALRELELAAPWRDSIKLKIKPNGLLRFCPQGVGKWKDDLIKGLRDRHEVPVGMLVPHLQNLPVEHWPIWARSAKHVASWRRLTRLNMLLKNLTSREGDVRPEFGFEAGRESVQEPVFRSFDFGAAAGLIEDADFHRDEGICGGDWSPIRSQVLMEHLRREHQGHPDPLGDYDPLVALAESTGLNGDCVDRLLRDEFRVDRKSTGTLPPPLESHLADRALECVFRSKRFNNEQLAEAMRASGNRGHDLYLALHEMGLDNHPGAARIRSALISEAPRTVKTLTPRSGFAPGTYHALTRETITLGTGKVLAGLTWTEARTAEVYGEAEEVRRIVIVELVKAGGCVVGLSDDTIWVKHLPQLDEYITMIWKNYLHSHHSKP